MKPVILVSACLLGIHCRYDGACQQIDTFSQKIPQLLEQFQIVPICPEQLGGLPTPRVPAEIYNGKVIAASGQDVDEAFNRGAQEAYAIAQMYHASIAILKARSPSCGSGQVYDGTFSKKLVDGDGKTAAFLKNKGVAVYTENDFEELLK